MPVPLGGHCNITPARAGAAFDDLLTWARHQKRPSAGELTEQRPYARMIRSLAPSQAMYFRLR